jgi:hypothetical protein
LPYFQFQNNEHNKKELHHYSIYKRCKYFIIINFFYLAIVTQAKPSLEFLDNYIGLLLAFEWPDTWEHIHPALTIHIFHIVKE